PFGIKTLTSKFKRVMSIILKDNPYALAFVDDVVIFSNNIEEHLLHVRLIIKALTKEHLIINFDKSHFYRRQILLLGFIIDQYGIKINPKKLVNIDDWEIPKTGKQVMSYMGLFNYFREHIPLYSTIATPIEELRNKKIIGDKWGIKQQKAFNTMKNLLSSAQVLSFPNFSLPFHIATDASNVGIGAVLYQLIPGKEKKPKCISFIACTLQECERKYSATKKELLGVVYALKKFQTYLWGNKFTLYKDHRALIFMFMQKN